MKQDYSSKKTDQKLRKLEKRLHEVYQEALQEVAEKMAVHLDKYDKQREKKAESVANGELDQQEYTDWLKHEAYKEKHHRRMIDVLSQDAYNTNKIAEQMITEHSHEVYALNRNYAAYTIDTAVGFDTSYALYSKDTVERLFLENPDLLPMYDQEAIKKIIQKRPDLRAKYERGGIRELVKDNPMLLRKIQVDKRKDINWNKKKFNNEIMQGILQGESVPKMAKRLERVMGMNRNTAIRNARTATTSAQNGGKMSAFRRARDLGIDVKKMWIATVDAHTRDSHRELDGKIKPLDEPFESEHGAIMEPGDPMADPAEVINCRCEVISVTKYSDFDPTDLETRFVRFDGEPPTYEEWKAGKNGAEYE